MADPATGETLTIVLFRDHIALDAYQAWSKARSPRSKHLKAASQ